jgi:GT2 family glycosyltransferase
MISIITITYNDFEGLKRTLGSIPDYDFIESVVINGGNDKASFDYLKFHNGKVINEKDEGIADAFNKGIAKSNGDAIMFLNSGDELIEPTYLLEADEILKKNDEIDFVHSNLVIFDSKGTDLFMKPPFCNPGRGLPYLHPTMIVRKSVFEQIGLFNKNFKIAMDFDFVVRLIQKGCKGKYINEKAVVKMEGTGISIAREWDSIKECYASLKQNKFLNLKNSSGLIVRITLYFLRMLLVTFGLDAVLRKLKMKKHTKPKF